MSDLFITTVKTNGLSRNKILWALAIVGMILLATIVCGSMNNDHDTNTMNNVAPSMQYSHLDSSSAATSIFDQVKQIKLQQSMQQVASTMLPSIKHKTASAIVTQSPNLPTEDIPPIVARDKVQFANSVVQTKEQYALKQVADNYSSASAKSLLFSSINNADTITGSHESRPTKDDSSVSVASADVVGRSSSAATKPDFSAMNQDTLASRITPSVSPYELKAGSVIPAIMLNGINSDLPGEIVAQVRENVYDSATRRYLLIPQGARLIGLYNSRIIYGQERILVAWNRLIYPNGSGINLQALPGTDLAGYAGFHDLVDNKYWQIFGSSFIMGVITAGMQYSQNNTDTYAQSGGPGFYNPTVGQTLAGSLGQQLGQTGLEVSEKNLNVQPTLIIRPNYPFNVMLTADLVLVPLATV